MSKRSPSKDMTNIRPAKGCTDGTRWEIYFNYPRDPVTKKRRVKSEIFVGTAAEARIARDAMKVEMNDDKQAKTAIVKATLTVGEAMNKWFDLFVANNPKKAPKTKGGYRTLIDGRLMQDFGKIKLRKLDFDTIQAAVNRWQVSGKLRPVRGGSPVLVAGEGLSPRSVHAHIAVLRMVLKRCRVTWKFIHGDPTEGLELPDFGAKAGDDEPQWYDWNELKTLFAAADAVTGKSYFQHLRLKAVIRLAAFYGLRMGEVFGLSFKRIDIDGRTMLIKEVASKPGGQRPFLKESPKTIASKRWMVLDDVTAGILLQLRNYYTKTKHDNPDFDGQNLQLVFGDTEGNVYDPGNFNGEFKRLTMAAGLKSITLHELRHTHSTLLNKLGVKHEDRERRLGHSDASINGHYTHIDKDQQLVESAMITKLFVDGYAIRTQTRAA